MAAAPLLGIHAYYINAKPVYAAFLADIEANNGKMEPWTPVSEIADGFFPENPWVGIVVQKNPAYTGDTVEYQTQYIVLSDEKAEYKAVTPQETTFQTAFAGYFGAAPTPGEDYFNASEKQTTQFAVTISYNDTAYSDTFVRVVPPKKGATAWSDVVTRYGNVFVDDARMKEKYAQCPAQFFDEAFYYFAAAIPRFNLPTQIIPYLVYTKPYFSFYEYTAPSNEQDGNGEADSEQGTEPQPTTEPTVVQTRQFNYEICSVVIYSTDQFGNPIETAYSDAVYDSVSGGVTLPAGIVPGTVFRMYFAIDGYFTNTLTQEMKRLLGLAFQLVWENRFTGEWLPRAAKVSDKSFSPPNEANWTRAQEEKRRGMEASFNDEMWRYEQNCVRQGALNGTGITLL